MTKIDLPPYHVGAGRLITARSYMLDRFVPDCEIISLPAKQVAGGELSFRKGAVTLPAVAAKGRAARLRHRLKPPAPRQVEGRVLFDLRHHDPQNWAHFLNNHLPIVFRLCEETGVGWDEALLVTPAATATYMRAAAAVFGLELLPTDAAVSGEGISFEMAPWTAVRTQRADWVHRPEISRAISAAATGTTRLPKRPFLARRDTRVIANMPEVEACLSARGYETVYVEDLPAADQLRLFREAEAMVAVHGAALAPLLYVPPDGPLRHLVEILPVGHMTDVYRVMAEQVGVSWIGVRGKIKPEYVEPAYRLGARFSTFSLDSFEVDVVALERALDFAGAERPDGPDVDGNVADPV